MELTKARKLSFTCVTEGCRRYGKEVKSTDLGPTCPSCGRDLAGPIPPKWREVDPLGKGKSARLANATGRDSGVRHYIEERELRSKSERRRRRKRS